MIEGMEDWTFKDADTRRYTHIYHDYPARMIPQVAERLLAMYGSNARLLYDPYCGTGTSLVEAELKGIDAIGTDLNPLARLIAEAKTDPYIDPNSVSEHMLRLDFEWSDLKPDIPKMKNIDFWFKKEAAYSLGKIRNFLNNIENKHTKLFFEVAFSETVRESSNTRKDEFKIFRYDDERLKAWNPDPLRIFKEKLRRNLEGLIEFRKEISAFGSPPHVSVFPYNSVNEIPNSDIPEGSADIIITSPPYGDSHTTVAYGQYSKFSSIWLGLTDRNIDKKLMGGSKAKSIDEFPSEVLNKAISAVSNKNYERALEVSSFYADLLSSIVNVSRVLKANGYACYVVANRTVASVILPTSDAIRDFFESQGFAHIATFVRDIPNKRMPLRNSPTNVSGETSSTMLKEHIIVMQKGKGLSCP
ncbi:DNA methyltransferase [Thermoplasma sp. Kam2015]|uniref:DNA methyltransferase n=1 Tax=Thermoplasma sp. Kam2015 TaxID=2094122 RepID=UPI000D832FB0|nr:DNA methyltransferase [Thermoplasma sp. Kam2015]PYB68142.1 DNA methyltransferase [Thermoplasma sp. Kam2015]